MEVLAEVHSKFYQHHDSWCQLEDKQEQPSRADVKVTRL